jgi:outer membrane biogenesis lipoprotein LolB
MKQLILPALAALALAACASEIQVDDPQTPQETPDETPKAKTVAFKIDGMK